MNSNRKWIERNRKELTEKYPNKVVVVVGQAVVRVFEPSETDVLQINRLGRELSQGGEWAYTTLSTAKGLL